jgi:phage/plasmid primase-like uncharacterized protein/antirestriction protein ArdC
MATDHDIQIQEARKERPHEVLTAQLISLIEKGAAPWQKSWRAGEEAPPPYEPRSGAAGTVKYVYNAFNRLMLFCRPESSLDPRWMPENAFKALAYYIREEQAKKSEQLIYWEWNIKVDRRDETGRPVLDENGNPEKTEKALERPRVSFIPVYNASQVEDAQGQDYPPYTIRPVSPEERRSLYERAEAIIVNSGVEIRENPGKFFDHRSKTVFFPGKDSFSSASRYYPEMFFLLSESACSDPRLKMLNFIETPYGSEDFGRGKLRVTIATWMLCQDLGIDYLPPRLAFSDAQWYTDILRQDPYEIVRACRDAEEIKRYLMGLEHTRKQEPAAAQPQQAEETAAKTPEPAAKDTLLSVPYAERGAAKALGARWDKSTKRWFAPAGADLASLAKWIPKEEKQLPAPIFTPEEEFAVRLAQLGLKLKSLPVMDGQIHRAAVDGGKAGSLDGSYCGFLDGRANGWAQNFKTGEKIKWVAGHTLSPEKLADLKAEFAKRQAERKEARERGYKKAAEQALCKYNDSDNTSATSAHPYLKAKGIKYFDDLTMGDDGKLHAPGIKGIRAFDSLKVDRDGNLLVPGISLIRSNLDGLNVEEIGDAQFRLQTLQTISPDGKKRYEPGSQKEGAMHLINDEKFVRLALMQRNGKLDKADPPRIFITEGYATGASIHQATGAPVAVAFDAGNLKPVAVQIREKLPTANIVICADNDHSVKVRGEYKNVGLEKAFETARAVSGDLMVPLFSNEQKGRGLTDFNDLHQERGLEAIGQIVQILDNYYAKAKDYEAYIRERYPISYEYAGHSRPSSLTVVVLGAGMRMTEMSVIGGDNKEDHEKFLKYLTNEARNHQNVVVLQSEKKRENQAISTTPPTAEMKR